MVTRRETSSAPWTGAPPIATIRSPPSVTSSPLYASVRCPAPRGPALAAGEPALDAGDERAAVGAEVERWRSPASRPACDADVRVADLPGPQQLVERPPREVDRDREADALGRPGLALDLRVDPDHAPGRVEQRPSGVAPVDRRVDLDRVRDLNAPVSESIERPMAETTPTESEPCWPNGLPIAATGWPTRTAADAPSGTGSTVVGPGRRGARRRR